MKTATFPTMLDGLRRNAPPAWLLALGALIAAIGVRLALTPVFGHGWKYITFYPAVLIVATLCGRRAGLLAAVFLAGLIELCLWPAPTDAAHWLSVAFFLASSVLMCAIAHRYRRSQSLARALAAERELDTLRSRYAPLREHSRDITLFFRSRDGRIVEANDAAVAAYGCPREELLAKSFFDLRAPETRDTLHTQLAAARERSITLQCVHLRGDGSRFPIEATWSCSGVDDEEVVLIVARDITERIEAEEKLRASEERFRVLTTASPQLIWECDADGRCTYQAPQWEAATGQSAAAALGYGWLEMIHPEDRERARAEWQAQRASGAYESEYRLRSADGSYRWTVARARARRDAAGAIAGWVGTCADVHEARVAESALRESEERFRRASDAAGALVYDVDFTRARPTRVHGLAQVTGFEAEAQPLTSEWWHSRIHPDDLAAHVQQLQHFIAEGRKWRASYRFRHADGSWRWAEDNAEIVRGPGGAPLRMVGAIVDVTARRLAEEELREAKRRAEEANAAKDRFLAALSHELRTPLSPVLMLAGAYEHSPDLSAELRADFATIRQNILTETQLIDDLLDVARITQGKMRLHFSECDVHEAIARAADAVRGDFESRGVALHMDLRARRRSVSGDRTRLQQVIWNLLRNAAKFTPRGGTVTVSSVEDGGALRVSVVDTGSGIAPDELRRIFGAFHQAETGAAALHGGLGLGLAICANIVAEHGGHIWAESEGTGRGAAFHVTLPLLAALETEPASPPAALTAGPRRILLVEDHEPTRAALARLLARRGHCVAEADSAAGARALADQGGFDVVISDLGLPDGDGVDLMRELRERYGLAGIALTGHGEDTDLLRSRAAGVQAHLVKPVEFEALEHSLARIDS